MILSKRFSNEWSVIFRVKCDKFFSEEVPPHTGGLPLWSVFKEEWSVSLFSGLAVQPDKGQETPVNHSPATAVSERALPFESALNTTNGWQVLKTRTWGFLQRMKSLLRSWGEFHSILVLSLVQFSSTDWQTLDTLDILKKILKVNGWPQKQRLAKQSHHWAC